MADTHTYGQLDPTLATGHKKPLPLPSSPPSSPHRFYFFTGTHSSQHPIYIYIKGTHPRGTPVGLLCGCMAATLFLSAHERKSGIALSLSTFCDHLLGFAWFLLSLVRRVASHGTKEQQQRERSLVHDGARPSIKRFTGYSV